MTTSEKVKRVHSILENMEALGVDSQKFLEWFLDTINEQETFEKELHGKAVYKNLDLLRKQTLRENADVLYQSIMLYIGHGAEEN